MKPFIMIAKYARPHPVYGLPEPAEGGYFEMPSPQGGVLSIMASWIEGWDHVSISRPDRIPTWGEMDFVKRAFFREDEAAYQLHPPVADHINCHPRALHIWRPHGQPIPMPPKEFV